MVLKQSIFAHPQWLTYGIVTNKHENDFNILKYTSLQCMYILQQSFLSLRVPLALFYHENQSIAKTTKQDHLAGSNKKSILVIIRRRSCWFQPRDRSAGLTSIQSGGFLSPSWWFFRPSCWVLLRYHAVGSYQLSACSAFLLFLQPPCWFLGDHFAYW